METSQVSAMITLHNCHHGKEIHNHETNHISLALGIECVHIKYNDISRSHYDQCPLR
jgi:hypothetical protein